MKVKKLKLSQKLLELYLIKFRVYEQHNAQVQSGITTIDLNQMLASLKKILRILFKFHTKNKKILFLGLDDLVLKKINRTTIHSALPSKIKLQGIISNKTQFKNNSKYSLLKLKKKPDLIVILDQIDSYYSLLAESYVAKIPTITFGKSVASKTNSSLYNIPTNHEFLLRNKLFFYNCLKFLFKKPKTPKNEKKKI